MHRTVAVVPGTTHLGPSVGPVAHTNETMASPSAQRTVFSGPVTMRKPCMPPGSPFGPGGPAGPCGPCTPAGPGGPCGPGVGWPHPATASAATMAKMLNTCCIGRIADRWALCLILSDMGGACHSTVRPFAQCPLSNNSGQSRILARDGLSASDPKRTCRSRGTCRYVCF
jgi:hypothetical protein